MVGTIYNVVCGIISSIIYDISKYYLGSIENKNKKDNFELKKIKEYVNANFDERFESLCESGTLEEFLKSPQVYDTITNYIVFQITGKIRTNKDPKLFLPMIKNNFPTINENNIISFLSNQLMKKYKYNNVISKPPISLVKKFFIDLFNICTTYIYNNLDKNQKAIIYFVNYKINTLQNNIQCKMDKIINILNKTIKTNIIYENETFINNKNYYTKILKENHKMAHIYLLDKFEINSFYVPPFLEQNEKRTAKFFENGISSSIHHNFDKWKYIFKDSNIIYITGGAGYGKSLFMKKLIQEYDMLEFINANEYMIIYGELKMFYPNNSDSPLSVLDFLQNSMKKETLIEEEIISKELINYYIQRGRCIILLDALDEVEKSKRNKLHSLVVNYFKNQNPNNKVCITSRARGFLPENNIEVFKIKALDAIQIEKYVDNIIKLGKFNSNDRDSFLKQTEILVKKGFLNSFLVLSLLINIYKAEKELPENKLELYQKCFEYIANKREREKGRAQYKYDWKLISILMKDNTFMELANLCLPNNSDVSKDKIKNKLKEIYIAKYSSENETDVAIEQFLQFCSDRTELFVPASGEDCFKFFHRSFFEYFYSQYIFTRKQNIKEIYTALCKFDVDSEVFELTLAIFKQKNEIKYQKIIEFLLDKIYNKSLNKKIRLNSLNILILGLQVIDDNLYKNRIINFFIENYTFCTENINNIYNQTILVDFIMSDSRFYQMICKKYKHFAIYENIDLFFKQCFYINKIIKYNKNLNEIITTSRRSYMLKSFYSIVYFSNKHPKCITKYFEVIKKLGEKCNKSNDQIKKMQTQYYKYLNLNSKVKQVIENILLDENQK